MWIHAHASAAQQISSVPQRVLIPWSVQTGLSPPVIVRGEGCFFYDDRDKKYLDLTSGYVAVALGHGHPKVVEAIQRQTARLCWTASSYFSDLRTRYAERLSAISPWGPEGARTHFTCGGAEANDDAIRIAKLVTRRPKVMSAYRSYHGGTIGGASLSGIDRWRDPFPNLPGVVRFLAPYPYRSPFHAASPAEEAARALAHVEQIISHEGAQNIAAIMIEPVTGSSGLVVYPDGYLHGLRAICDRTGILLIFDEVMTGFGRVGKAFGAIRLACQPDLLSFAKGASSSYVPLGGVLVREKVAAHFDSNLFDIGHTHSGHILAVAAGLAALDVYEQEGLFERSIEIERWLKSGLAELKSRHPDILGDVRGLGSLFGLELVKDPDRREPLVAWHDPMPSAQMKAFYGELMRRGVHAYGRYNICLVAPPLNIRREELDLGLAALDGALAVAERG